MESSSPPPLTTVKVLGQYQISAPPGSVPQVCIPLTYLDVNWVFVNIMVERIFYYQFTEPGSFLVDHVVPKLKSSLSLALQHFYPLAGNLRLSPGTTDKYEIHCKDGDSVSFAVAESDADFKYLSERHVNELKRVYPLLPQFPREDSKPMLAIRVTLFPNSGISIAVAIHHAASDDSGIMHFIKSWASACSSGGSAPFLQPPPLIDRSVIPDPHGLYSHRVQLGQRNPVNRAPKSDPVCGATFLLGIHNILKLKQLATAKTETPFHCSTFVVACAYAWVCVAKALRYQRDERALFIFPMDIRDAVLPRMAANASYFGNCVRPCHVEAEVAQLVEDDGGFQLAAEAIGRAIQRCRSDGVGDAKLWRERNAFARMAGRILTVSGSPKIGVHDTDYGWGRPCKVEVAPRGTGAIGMIALAESRDEAGGIEIGLFLPRNQMEEFSICFHGGLV